MSPSNDAPQANHGLRPHTPTFHLHTTASSHSCRTLTRAALRIISDNIRDEELLYFFDLALFEACTNVARHAYGQNAPGELHLTLTITPGKDLQITVTDFGKGFTTWPVTISNADPQAECGRGLYMISQIADSLSITREEGATKVHFTINLRDDQWIAYE